MEIYCPVCGAEVLSDNLHHAAEDRSTTYDAMCEKFRATGCAALGMRHEPIERQPVARRWGMTRAECARALYDEDFHIEDCANMIAEMFFGEPVR